MLKTIDFLYPSYCTFGIYMKFQLFRNKNERHKSSISEVIDSERCANLNTSQGIFLKIELEKVIFNQI